MPKLPWVKWYPMAWASEPGLKACELSTRAIWFEIINTMFLTGTGRISGTMEHLCRQLSVVRTSQMELALQELQRFSIAEVVREQNRTNDEQTEIIIVTCRRNLRTVAIKQLRSDAGRASGLVRRTKGEQTSPSPSPSKENRGVGKGGNGLSEADKVIKDKALGRALIELRDLRRGDLDEAARARIKILKAHIASLEQELGVQI